MKKLIDYRLKRMGFKEVSPLTYQNEWIKVSIFPKHQFKIEQNTPFSYDTRKNTFEELDSAYSLVSFYINKVLELLEKNL